MIEIAFVSTLFNFLSSFWRERDSGEFYNLFLWKSSSGTITVVEAPEVASLKLTYFGDDSTSHLGHLPNTPVPYSPSTEPTASIYFEIGRQMNFLGWGICVLDTSIETLASLWHDQYKIRTKHYLEV